MSNPYADMVSEMQKQARGQAPPGLCLGTVLSAGADTFQILCDNGLTLGKGDLMVNAMLLSGAEESVSANLSGRASLDINAAVDCFALVGETPITSITLYELPGALSASCAGTLALRRLQSGDRVVLLPSADGQTYYVLCKVVAI